MRGFIVEVKSKDYCNPGKTLYIKEFKIKRFFDLINLYEWELVKLEFKSDLVSLNEFEEEFCTLELDLETGEDKLRR